VTGVYRGAVDAVSREDWCARAADAGLAEAGCLTAVIGADEDVVLAAFGADPDTRMTLEEWSQGGGAVVALVRLGEGVVVAEWNGFEGSREEVLRPASRRGRAASVSWNVNGIVVLSCARRGRTLGQAELVGLDDEAALPADLLTGLIEAERNGVDSVLAGVGAVSRFTGVPLDRWELTADARVHPITTVEGDFRPADPVVSVLKFAPPGVDVLGLLAGLTPSAQRTVAEWAARQALQRTGLDTDHRAAAVLAGFGTGSPASFSPALSMLAAIRRENEVIARTDPSSRGGPATPRMREAWMRMFAVNALRHATVDDPFAAAIGAAGEVLPFHGSNFAALAAAIGDVVGQHPY